MDASVKELLEANRHPENFVCTVCGKKVTQDQTTTQRKGWPVCHQMTMKEYTPQPMCYCACQ